MKLHAYAAALAVVPAIFLAGCTAKYDVKNLSGMNAIRLDRSKAVYVAVPQDGAYGNRRYPGSGQMVAQAVAAAFSGRAEKVHMGQEYSPSTAPVEAAKSIGAAYAVVPVIAHWEHRNTAWSGIPSRMSIRLTVFDVTTGQSMVSSAIEGRSRIASWTATSPESLLKDPVNEYVQTLY